jgi:hypothetical protein
METGYIRSLASICLHYVAFASDTPGNVSTTIGDSRVSVLTVDRFDQRNRVFFPVSKTVILLLPKMLRQVM